MFGNLCFQDSYRAVATPNLFPNLFKHFVHRLALLAGITMPPWRSMLIALLAVAVGGVPIIENPLSTVLQYHPRFRVFVELLKARGISPSAEILPARSNLCTALDFYPLYLVFFWVLKVH